jgi:hypothetical protein
LLLPVRTGEPALGQGFDEPHAEWLAMVWGPRFDRLHALRWLAQLPASTQVEVRLLLRAADHFDGLAPSEQGRLRRLIQRHHRRWDNAATPKPHAPHPAD